MAEAWRHVGIILGVSLIPFTALALLPLSDYVRFLAHNFLGFGIIGVLCAYYIRAIEADTSHKTFAFVLAICYGHAVGMVWNFAINTFDLARNPDQTYKVMTLAALLPITVVSLCPWRRSCATCARSSPPTSMRPCGGTCPFCRQFPSLRCC